MCWRKLHHHSVSAFLKVRRQLKKRFFPPKLVIFFIFCFLSCFLEEPRFKAFLTSVLRGRFSLAAQVLLILNRHRRKDLRMQPTSLVFVYAAGTLSTVFAF
ncbi:hypothetical protein GOODEAATRI_022392 [Goodea atripinnis]|uniref:Uncharacterized protein n=1 Tax=Goodea atripinnis TaxID=208336 RepID=A0ABV0PG31_9TELE